MPSPAARLRVIYTDLDGTLLGAGGSLFQTAAGRFTQAGARALELCRAGGVELTFVSGRSINLLHEDARLLGVRNYIAEAGCVVVRGRGEEMHLNCGPFTGGPGVRVFDEIAATGAPDLLMGHFGPRLAYHTPWFEDHDYSHLFRGFIDVAEADGLLAAGGHPDMKVVDNGIIEDRGYGMDVPELHAYHLIPRQAGKGSAIGIDRALTGVSRQECIACGDSAQDLEMAPAVRKLYLMSNCWDDNPGLQDELAHYDNVEVVQAQMVEGFFEAVSRELG